jgi:hypothetical protein
VTPEIRTFMETLSKEISVGVVGGTDLVKQQEQLGEDGTVHVCCVFPCWCILLCNSTILTLLFPYACIVICTAQSCTATTTAFRRMDW